MSCALEFPLMSTTEPFVEQSDLLSATRSEEPTPPTELHLKDYTPPSHLIDKTELTFELNAEAEVIVSSRLTVRPNPQSQAPNHILQLKGAPQLAGEGTETPTMDLLEIKLNGRTLSPTEYQRENDDLSLTALPSEGFVLEIKTRINPQANRSLSGLYTSGGKFTTQCESEGFRNITFYLDRPDVMSEYTTTIIAPAGKYTQLLSNGNPGPRTKTSDGRDQITWHDPFKKPSYLFALVAGNLAMQESSFQTMSGRPIKIQIFSDFGNEHQLDHAMTSVKQAMAWDEQRFGREYDLDLFQIVAVHDFNFGAMENKGLNIFNASAVLTDPNTATDARYEYVQAVVGHEYFHNWSGNRVTLQKWFDLTLKEGFTVFRDSEFTADLNSRAVKRIEDVLAIRTRQFIEDASAMAHPIRPASVGSIENFYTSTVYEKGAEVIRMIHTLLGEEAFRKGSDLYFQRHDGQAVSTEDFVKAMSDASGVDLKQFEQTWYNQAGTPILDVTDHYDPQTQAYHLTIRQSTPATPGQPMKAPFHIPIRLGLLDQQGHDLPLHLAEDRDRLTHGDLLHLKENEKTFVFRKMPAKPLPSLLRHWSAPVKLNYAYTPEQLTFLMANDNDGFNRWEAGQKLGVIVLQELVQAFQHGKDQKSGKDQREKDQAINPLLIEAFQGVLQDQKMDKALAAYSLVLPEHNYLAGLYPDGQVDVDAIHAARKKARQAIGQALEPLFREHFEANRSTENRPYAWNMPDVGERAIKNISLSYLIAAKPQDYLPWAIAQFDHNHNMTDVRAALRHILDHAEESTRQQKLAQFYRIHQGNALAINQWFQDQAVADQPEVLHHVQALLSHPAYDSKNPNCVRSLVGAFAANTVHFHDRQGAGYQFLTEQIIEIDKFNPSLAAGLTKQLATPHRYDAGRQQLMKAQLETIRAKATSNNVREIVEKSLELLSAKT
jgi:aminopeptidase N